MFFRKQVFEQLGGYPEIPILEDLEFQRQARKLGGMARILTPVRTSARRFLANGVIRQCWINFIVLTGYFAGVSPAKLARLYYA